MKRYRQYLKIALLIFSIINVIMMANISASSVAPESYTKEEVAGMTAVESITINGDGSTVVNVFYTRNSYGITTNTTTGIASVTGGGTYKFEAPVTVKASVAKGYSFKQWTSSNTSLLANSTNAQYSFTTPAGAVALTASATITPYTITYNLNGGTMTSQTTNYNVETSTFSVVNPTRVGYEFLGWTVTNDDSTGYKVESNTKNIVVNKGTYGNLVFTAHWEPITYTIDYEMNGGINDSQNPDTYTIENANIQLITPIKEHYNFLGWTISNDSGPFGIDSNTVNAVIPIGTYGNLTITANWSAKEYPITYQLNGGENAASNPTSYTVENSNISLAQPNRNCYDFIRWDVTYVNDSNRTTESVIETNHGGEVIATAIWEPTVYSITYEMNGGENAADNPSSYTIESADIVLNQPTKEHYTFTGWTIANDDENGFHIDTNTENITIPQGTFGNLTITANWETVNYSITYDLDGGSDPGIELGMPYPTEYTIETPTFALHYPFKDGYTFTGWTIENDDAEGFTIDTETEIVHINEGTFGNLSITAHWSINPYYLLDDPSNEGVTFEDGVEYHIHDDVVLHPVVEDGWFLYPIDEKHPNAIQVKLSDTDNFITYSENLHWKSFDIIVKAETEPLTDLQVKSDELRKFFIENEYLPYHIDDEGNVIDPYGKDISMYTFYSIDSDWLADLSGQIIDLHGLTIVSLPNMIEFKNTFNCSFINYSLTINQDIIDQYDDFEQLVEDLLDLGQSNIIFKDTDLSKFGDLIFIDGVEHIEFDNCVTGSIIIDESVTTIHDLIIKDTTVNGKVSVDNHVIENIVIDNSSVSDILHINSESASMTTTDSHFYENADITLKNGSYSDERSIFEKDLTITITDSGDVSLTDTTVKGNLTINGNQTNVDIDNVIVGGDATITVKEGNVDINESDITGNLTVDVITDGNISITDTHVGGDTHLHVGGNGNITVSGSELDGNYEAIINGNGDITIIDTSIHGDCNVSIGGDGNINFDNVTVDGTTTIDIGGNGGVTITDSNLHDTNIHISGDGNVTIDNSIIDGNLSIDIDGSGDVTIIDSTINGNLDITVEGESNIIIDNTTITGDVTVIGPNLKDVIITDSTINGNLTIDEADNVDLTGTTIGGELSINGVKVLNLSNRNMTDEELAALQVLQKFPILEEINLSGNVLTELDSETLPTTLERIDVSNNTLKEVDLHTFSNIQSVNLANNALSEIDLSMNTKLTDINLKGNMLSTVSFMNNSLLEHIDISENAIPAIDLSYLNDNENLIDVAVGTQRVYVEIPYGSKEVDLSDLSELLDVAMVSNVTAYNSINGDTPNETPSDIASSSDLLHIDESTVYMRLRQVVLAANDSTDSEEVNYTYENGIIKFNTVDDITSYISYEYDTGYIQNEEPLQMKVEIIVSVQEKSVSASKVPSYKSYGDGIRVSIFNTITNEIMYVEDYTNQSVSSHMMSFGYHSKYELSAETVIKKTGGYSYYIVPNSMPQVFGDYKYDAFKNDIKAFFGTDDSALTIAHRANIDYNALISGDYVVLLEPITFANVGGSMVVFTPTEMALYDMQNDGYFTRNSARSALYDGFAGNYYLSQDEFGWSSKAPNKLGKVTNEEILNGLGVVTLHYDGTKRSIDSSYTDSVYINPTYSYHEDIDVYTSIWVKSNADRTHENPIKVQFISSEFNYTTMVEAPKNTEQLAWVKWHTPQEETTVSINVFVDDTYVYTIPADIKAISLETPPDTKADDSQPIGWNMKRVTNHVVDSTSWTVWESKWIEQWYYQPIYSIDSGSTETDSSGYWVGKWSFYEKGTNESLPLDELGDTSKPFIKTYTVQLNSDTSVIPDADLFTDTNLMKSGYGVNVSTENVIRGNGEHTEVQTGYATFPEFEYKKYGRFLDGTMNMELPENKYDLNNSRTHFTPIWYPDGKYTVRVDVTNVWTPNGVLSTVSSDYVQIEGNVWNDWAIVKN